MVVGWDGADWAGARPLLDAGHLPTLASLIRAGGSGSIRGFAPWLPPVLWTTLATGAPPDRHGIHAAAVFDETTGRACAAGTAHRRTPALWNDFASQGRSCAVLGWPGTYPAETVPHGIMVSGAFAHAPLGPNDPWPVPAGAVSPASRAADLGELRIRPQEINTGLLGLFLPELQAIDQTLDARPDWLIRRLSELYTLHNTAVVLAGVEQPDFLAVRFPFIAALEKEFGLFQAPRHPAAGTADCDRYGKVVSSAYRLMDALLADLIAACAADTAVIVVSTHGLARGGDRPVRRPDGATDYAAWCRPDGLLVMKAPGLPAGEKITGTRLEDLAPRVRALAGLPPGDNAGTGTPWSPVIAPSDARPAALAQARILLRLADQRLVHPLTASWVEAGRLLVGENALHLGTALMDEHRADAALPPLYEAFLLAPESPGCALALIHCLLQFGLAEEGLSAARLFLDHGQHDARHLLTSSARHLIRKRPQDALALLAQVTESEFAENRRVLERLAFSRLRRTADETASFQYSLAARPESAGLWLGLARAQVRAGQLNEAKTSARRARELDPRLPEGASMPALAASVTPDWPQLMKQAAARQRLRAALRHQFALHQTKRAQLRATLRPLWPETQGPAPAHETGEFALSPAEPPTAWTARPPWPDEMPRIEARFPRALRSTGKSSRQWLWVLAVDATERLAGVIVLSELTGAPGETAGPGPHGRVDVDIREAWVDTPAGDALLAIAVRHATVLGMTSLHLQACVSEDMQALLGRHAFAEAIRHELWVVPVAEAIAHLRTEYDRILKRWPVPIEPFHAGHLEIAREICAGTGLLAADQVVLKSKRRPQGIDPALSFVAGPPGEPVAILLSGIAGSRSEVEILARNPLVLTASPTAIIALMLRHLLAAQNLGCLDVRCSLRPSVTPNLPALMEKGNGRCVQRHAAYRRRLG